MEFIWAWVCAMTAVFSFLLVADAIAGKTPWREVAPTAAFFAAVFAGLGALMHVVALWAEQSGWGGLLTVIGFLCMVFVLVCALVGGVLRALYRD